MEKPYEEKRLSDDTIIRVFSDSVGQDELKWHQDAVDRIITPMNKNDWMFQFDNEMPLPINKRILIKNHVWHRIIRGSGDLVLKIKELGAR